MQILLWMHVRKKWTGREGGGTGQRSGWHTRCWGLEGGSSTNIIYTFPTSIHIPISTWTCPASSEDSSELAFFTAAIHWANTFSELSTTTTSRSLSLSLLICHIIVCTILSYRPLVLHDVNRLHIKFTWRQYRMISQKDHYNFNLSADFAWLNRLCLKFRQGNK